MVQTILRREAVERLTGLKRSSIYQGVSDGSFPRPVKLGPKAVGWLEDDIAAWQQKKIAERDGTKPRKAA